MKSWFGTAATVFTVTLRSVLAQTPELKPAGPKAWAKPTASATARAPDTSVTVEIYGFAMGDAIYDFNQNNPDWFDVNRPSKLPSFTNEFGANGHTWIGARQSRFGVR